MKRIRIIMLSFFIMMGSSLFLNQNSSDTIEPQSIDYNLAPISQAEPIIADHTIINTTRFDQIPESIINQTKDALHIAYGHTSHGSQVTEGMSPLSAFKEANGGTEGLYDWHDGPEAGSLDLDDYFMSGDLGHNGDLAWAASTRTYLDNSANSDVNVVMWSWCGGVSDNTEEGINIYLNEMNSLESEYPGVKFVYMTGHASSSGTGELGNTHIRNQQIRDYCVTNSKILFDFYDIECYDPDGNEYFTRNVTDGCYYDGDGDGSYDSTSNWATEWQDSHTQDVDWYSCGSAHSQPLNANMKAYAAWWMFCRIAGWDGSFSSSTEPSISDEIGGFIEYSSSVPSFTWDVTNFLPSQYEIFINDSGQGLNISSDASITYNFTGYSLGTYNITLKVFNSSGDWIQDDLSLTIQDMTAPILEQPLQNIIAGLDENPIPLAWDIFDLLGDYYILSLNSVVEVEAVWDGEDLSYSLTNPGIGEYNVSLFLNDTSGNSVIFSQILYISDSPQILSHENCSFEQGSENNFINWTCYDSNPAFYQFYVNSVSQGIFAWDGAEINFAFDGYAIGVYNLTLWVNDTEGNWDQETIFITVVAQTTTTTDSTTTTETSSTSDTSTTTSDLPPSSETSGGFLGISTNTLVGAGFGAGFLGVVVVMAVVIKKQR
ncbi:hypothetical protein NEF87_003751 [Candidatus Lokiarchaeum ossiferum]|uniref:PKD domain-containing protein n=1 Tax=Candidatus Lokiarchaeum ossiferum TaxID=2951803 RepID=A0ABY6HVN9_9ARCH|nr:hypothetical protein NEF87_003751 [Candidatus Lokiarchaeum sp. B-35]